jgi:hypothetical protein
VPPANVPIRRDRILFRWLRNGVGVFIFSSSAALEKEIGMRRTVLVLFSAAVALLLASGAVRTLPSEKSADTPMVDGRVRAILFTEVPGKTRYCEVNKMPNYTLSEYSQNRGPYCTFSGLGDCPNRSSFLSRALKRCLPVYTRAHAGTPQTLRSAPLDKPIMVG